MSFLIQKRWYHEICILASQESIGRSESVNIFHDFWMIFHHWYIDIFAHIPEPNERYGIVEYTIFGRVDIRTDHESDEIFCDINLIDSGTLDSNEFPLAIII